jgi:hypothetical protein
MTWFLINIWEKNSICVQLFSFLHLFGNHFGLSNYSTLHRISFPISNKINIDIAGMNDCFL